MLKDIFKRAGTHFGGSIISRIFATSTFILLSRYIPLNEYGQGILGITVIQLGNVAGDFGLTQWYQKQEHEEKAFFILLPLRLILGFVVSIAIVAMNVYLSWFTTDLALLIAGINLLQSFTSIASAYLILHKRVIMPSLLQAMLSIPILLLIFLAPRDVTLFNTYAAFALGNTFAIFILFPLKRLRFSPQPPSALWNALRSSSKYALLTYTSATYARADSILVRVYAGEAALGFYGLAYRYLEYFAMLPSSVVQILFPIFAQKEGTRKHLFDMTVVMGAIGAAVAGVVMTSASVVILTLHGTTYAASIPILKVLSGSLILFFVNAPLATFVQASDIVKKFLPFGIANTVLNVALNVALIPQFGILAAAYVMLTTEITGLLINVYFVRKVFRHRV